MNPRTLVNADSGMGYCSLPHCSFGKGSAVKERLMLDRMIETKFKASSDRKVEEH